VVAVNHLIVRMNNSLENNPLENSRLVNNPLENNPWMGEVVMLLDTFQKLLLLF